VPHFDVWLTRTGQIGKTAKIERRSDLGHTRSKFVNISALVESVDECLKDPMHRSPQPPVRSRML
jgi:hypothetical protein